MCSNQVTGPGAVSLQGKRIDSRLWHQGSTQLYRPLPAIAYRLRPTLPYVLPAYPPSCLVHGRRCLTLSIKMPSKYLLPRDERLWHRRGRDCRYAIALTATRVVWRCSLDLFLQKCFSDAFFATFCTINMQDLTWVGGELGFVRHKLLSTD